MLFLGPLIFCLSIFHKDSVFASSVPRNYGEIKLFEAPVTYDLNTTVTLQNDKQEIGYNIRATLRVEAAGNDQDTDFLLKFHLSPPLLALRGRERSAWPALGDSEFFAHWSRGHVLNAYLNPGDPLDILNFKIAIISLFQFQVMDGDGVETDISGTCDVSYETLSMTDIRKIKRCGAASSAVEARYSLQPSLRALRAVRLAERLELGLGHAAALQLALEARPELEPAAPAAAAPLAAALRALPAALVAARLEAADDDAPASRAEPGLQAALAALAGDEEAGGGGRAAAAAAALRLLPALQAADAPALLAALQAAPPAALPALCRALGRAATAAAHAAAAQHLALAGAEPARALAAHYLAGAALAPRPAPAAVRALLRLAGEARDAAVGARALLAAAGAAPRAADAALLAAVRDAARRALARCKDDECRAGRLHALGNLRAGADDDDVDVLLEHAERGGRAAALAALDALAALPAAALSHRRLARLEAVALQAGRPLEARAAALDLVLRRAAASRLPRLAAALLELPGELRRVLAARAGQLAERDAAVRAALRARGAARWPAAGSSSVLARAAGWARLDAVQVAAAGVLRRAVVTLAARPLRTDDTLDLEVSVWTRGLEELAGDAADRPLAGDEDEPPAAAAAAGLALAVGGVRDLGTTLFTGQAELLSHVWAGTGSTPTPVLRAEHVLRAQRARRRLASGALVAWRAGAAASLALDAQAQVSLWSRGAKLALELRAALHAAVDAELALPGGAAGDGAALRLEAHEQAEPRLHIAADLDFYDGVALCVRVHTADHRAEDASSLSWPGAGAGAGAARGGRRGRRRAAAAPGRTLALGGDNDRTCRSLAAAA